MAFEGKKGYIIILGIEMNLYGNPQIVRVSISLLNKLIKINYFFNLYIKKCELFIFKYNILNIHKILIKKNFC